ncbi:restriction endonuclease subunit S [Enterobacter bugandensis]|uniref:restriction endonuclease subunit S n=1 Tax=Enterobacter bugandensis TaxID=881260 RepID=UPI002D77CA58|nr:restriction endonuclease subunit S [Enterobacter bugandensis]WRT49431.1 restriction endonuclease subunit S [Enterobacter bugandensis]
MAKYKAYPEYKDSGVIFLDNPPSHWHTIKIKHLLKLKNEIVGNNHTNFTLLSLTLNGVITRDISSGEGKIPESFATYQRVERNDLIFCLFDMDETPRTVGLSSQSGMITGAYNVYKCNNKADPSFIYYYFLYIDSFKRLKPYYTGLRKVVRSETFDSLKLHLPSIKEKLKIAIYLGHQITSINGLIEKQLQLIELLKEKRQAVISHAVTKGLNPDVPMKDSGVEWLDRIPEHWNIIQVGRLYNRIKRTGKADKELLSVYREHGVIPKSSRDDNNNKPSDDLSQYQLVKIDDLVLNKMKAWQGSIAISKFEGIVSPAYFVYTPQKSINELAQSQYIHHLLRNTLYITQYLCRSKGIRINQWDLDPEEFKTIPVLLPPKTEQKEIHEMIDNETKKIDTLIQKQLQQIELLKERRTALIAAAVTGKIDLRNWTPPASSTEAYLTAEEATA